MKLDVKSTDVLYLRERTGGGLIECKKTLMACGGDLNKAIQYLRDHSGPAKCVLKR